MITEHDFPLYGTYSLNCSNANHDPNAIPTRRSSDLTLTSGASRTITLSRATTAADCGTLPNTVTVAATNERSEELTSEIHSPDDIVFCPLVDVTKSGNGTVSAGETSNFTITENKEGQ